MATDSAEAPCRREFLKDCGKFAPTCMMFGSVGGLMISSQSNAGNSAGHYVFRGICREEIYRDAQSQVCIVELDNGEYTIGLGPLNLDPNSSWEAHDLVDGNVPTVVYHPALALSERTRLERLLSQVT